MRTNVVRIGNSKGIRIPKAVLQQCGIGDAVSLEVKGGRIILAPVGRKARDGWGAAFQELWVAEEKTEYLPDGLDLDVGEWDW